MANTPQRLILSQSALTFTHATASLFQKVATTASTSDAVDAIKTKDLIPACQDHGSRSKPPRSMNGPLEQNTPEGIKGIVRMCRLGTSSSKCLFGDRAGPQVHSGTPSYRGPFKRTSFNHRVQDVQPRPRVPRPFPELLNKPKPKPKHKPKPKQKCHRVLVRRSVHRPSRPRRRRRGRRRPKATDIHAGLHNANGIFSYALSPAKVCTAIGCGDTAN